VNEPRKSKITSPISFIAVITAGLVITIGTGLVCGNITHRWGAQPDLLAAGAHLKTFPTRIGNWQLAEEAPMSDSEIAMLSCAGYVNRTYIDQKSGNTVSLAIYVGPPGPIAVHTPEVCYSSRDYTVEGERKRVQFDSSDHREHSLWNTKFRANNAIGERQSVYYGWLADETWIAADSPRFAFAGSPMLFKLQIAARVPPDTAGASVDPCQEFLREMLQHGWKVRG
jgi:hypothetical protein